MQRLFFLTGEFDDGDVEALHGVVSALQSSHRWMISALEFVDEEDENKEQENAEPEDLRIVGGVLQLPAVGPIETERRGLEDLEHLVDALVRYSAGRSREVELDFELDGTWVGCIQAGKTSSTLQEGLIDSWRDRVQSSS